MEAIKANLLNHQSGSFSQRSLVKIGYVGAALSLNVGAALLLTEVRVVAYDLVGGRSFALGGIEPPVPVDVLGSQSGREIAQLGGQVSMQPVVQLTARQRMSPST
jgi:hypothetical protein